MKSPRLTRRLSILGLAAALAVTLVIPASAQLMGDGDQPAISTVAAFSKNGTVQDIITFSPDDFAVENADSPLDTIVVTALPDPAAGVLTMGDIDLAVGDTIAMDAVAGMRFHPLTTPTVAATGFSFTPVFADGSAGADVTVGLYLLTAENSAPIAENMELSTYKNVPFTGSFSATDPEGDLLTFRLVEKPKRGSVTLPEEGSSEFVYTPYENKTGKDSFTYVAVDAVGNTSAPATVKIKIDKANTKVTYADMYGVPAYKAAIRLAEQGVLIGECMGGEYFFQPDAPVTRDQFVALAMNTVGLDQLEGIARTGFADDEIIPTWAKGYVSSALKSGVVQGTVTENGVTFNPDSTITRAEATVLLNRMLQVSDTAATTMFSDIDVTPAWAYQAAVNLESVDVLRPNADGALRLNDGMTRAEAAEMLSGALDVLEARQTGGWFHW